MGRPDKKTAGLNAFNEALRKLEGAPEPVPELTPGDRMPDGSIYLGVYRHKKLSAVFNVFAAPEDLFGLQYDEAVEHVARLRGWHGHDGEKYASDKALYKAMRKGRYAGGWVIPPREVLCGKNADDRDVMDNNLYSVVFKDKQKAMWRWSSTAESFFSDKRFSAAISWSKLEHHAFMPDGMPMRCRPVRFEPRTDMEP